MMQRTLPSLFALLLLGAITAQGRSVGGVSFTFEGNTPELLSLGYPSNLKGSVNRDLPLGPHRPTLSATYDLRSDQKISGLQLSGLVKDVDYELKHSVANKATTLDLYTSAPGGSILMAGFCPRGLRELSLFHTAGPINVQPFWIRDAKMARLKIGQGSARKRCPISMQVDYPLDGGKLSYAFGFRKLAPGRSFRARAEVSAGRAWVEYSDARVEPGATWSARLCAPINGGSKSPELVLRRTWKWAPSW